MTTVATPMLDSGTSAWVRSFALLVRRNTIALRLELAAMFLFQVLMGAGMALIYGFMLGELPGRSMAFIATGAPVLALIPVGIVFLPNAISNQKANGSHDFLWSLPVPRSAAAAADCVTFTAVTLPGAFLALLVAAWRYDVTLSLSPLLLPAIVLGALMTSAIGFGLGHGVEDPQIVNLITNLVIFVVLMYSPIAFPIEQFPGWLAAIHQVLPFHHLSVLIRGGLTEGLVSGVATSALVVAAWTLVGWAVAFRAIAVRR